MPLEIERKFLVRYDGYKKGAAKALYRQGYLSTDKNHVIRIRLAGDSAFLTIKGPTVGAVRKEFEYSIPVSDAQALLELCEKPLIEKIRYDTAYKGMNWEVDEFLGENAGLVIAEIELSGEAQAFQKPDWVGDEVTSDPRYYNSNLIHSPFKVWDKK